MKPKNVLLVDRLGTELARTLKAKRTDLKVEVRTPDGVTSEHLEWADVYVGFRPPEHLPLVGVPWVHCTGAGVDGFTASGDLAPTTLLTRTLGALGHRMAEYSLGHVLAIAQKVIPFSRAQDRRVWQPDPPQSIEGSTALILGTGEIGTKIGERLARNGIKVLGVSRNGQPKKPFEEVVPQEEAGSVLADADWILSVLPLTPETEGWIDLDFFAPCRDSCFLNLGRGRVLDETALVHALDRGWIRWAVLDVFPEEPLPENSELWTHERISITPHIAGLTRTSDAEVAFLECLEAIEEGRVPPLKVNLETGY